MSKLESPPLQIPQSCREQQGLIAESQTETKMRQSPFSSIHKQGKLHHRANSNTVFFETACISCAWKLKSTQGCW